MIAATATGGEIVKVLDFGLAKMRTASEETGGLTHPGIVMGTAGYMAPEQLTGGEVDHRADVFAIGVMVTEAIVGQRPFRGRTHSELLMSIANDPVTLGGEGAERRRLESVLRRATANDPADATRRSRPLCATWFRRFTQCRRWSAIQAHRRRCRHRALQGNAYYYDLGRWRVSSHQCALALPSRPRVRHTCYTIQDARFASLKLGKCIARRQPGIHGNRLHPTVWVHAEAGGWDPTGIARRMPWWVRRCRRSDSVNGLGVGTEGGASSVSVFVR